VSLHPVLAEKLSSALAPVPPFAFTRRDARLPAVPGKVHAVIGMRRAGKTTFLRQLLDERRAEFAPERVLYLSFDDDRLAGLELDQLGFLLEEYYRPGTRRGEGRPSTPCSATCWTPSCSAPCCWPPIRSASATPTRASSIRRIRG